MTTTPTEPRSAWECQSLADSLRRQLEIYTPGTLAAKLGISKRAVLRAIGNGDLRAFRVNSRVFQIESPDAARWWIGLSR